MLLDTIRRGDGPVVLSQQNRQVLDDAMPGACWKKRQSLEQIGARISLLRGQRVMSEGMLAHRLGVQRKIVWLMEYGQPALTPLLAHRLASIFRVSEKWLLTGDH